jgi:DNA-binding CsgD family transcriptional regulator
MKTPLHIVAFCAFLMLPSSFYAAINQLENVCVPKISYFDKTVYNAANQSWAIAQNKNGYLYFANSAGLLEYDGSQWTLYTLPDNTSIVRSIAIGGDQKIYTGIRNEFGYWHEDVATRKLKYASLSKAAKLRFLDEEIWKIVMQGEDVYFQSFRNIYKYNTRSRSIYIIPAPNRYQFMFKVGDRLFAQDKVSGLMELRDDRLVGVPGGQIFTGDCVYGMADYGNRSVLIATIDRGLFLMENNKVSPASFPCNPYLVKNQIFSMIPLPGGKFAFGTILNGLLIIDHKGTILSAINKPKGMPNNTVLSLFLDRSNNMWLGLDRGICHIQMNSPIRTFPDPKGLLGSIYQAEEVNGRLYFATNQGLFYCLLSDLSYPERELPIHLMEKSQGQVWGLQVVGNRLFCAHNKGIYVVDGDKGDFVYTKSGVTHWLYINDRTVLFMSYNGLCAMHIEGDKFTVKEQPTFPYDGDCLVRDKNNNVFLGSGSAGYYKVKFDANYDNVVSSTNQLSSMGIGKKNINGIFAHGTDVYAIDKGKGILRLDYASNRFLPEQKLNKLLPRKESILRLQISNDEMWCYATNSFFYIKDYATDHPSIVHRNMQSLYKQMISTFEHSKKIANGLYMVCTSNSLAVLNTEYSSKAKANKIYVRDIGMFGDSMKSMELPHPLEYYKKTPIEFPYNHKTIYVRFTLPNYESQGNILYSYRLRGSSDNFSIPSANNIATFTNLSAGEYVFQVRATIVGTKEVCYSQELRIKILPPWYLGWMGGVLLLLLLALIGLLYFKYLQRRWQKQQRRIMYAHEKEMSKMENLILQEQVKSQTDELARVTKAMLHKNKLMSKLDDEITKLAENKNVPHPDLKGLKSIVEKNKNPDEEWRVFEMSFNKTHDNYLVKLSTQFPGLTPSDLKLAAYIRMNINSKEIAGLMNISSKSIEMARYRLRKKLNLAHNQNLTEFLMGL